MMWKNSLKKGKDVLSIESFLQNAKKIKWSIHFALYS